MIWNWKWKKMLFSISSKYSYFKSIFNYTRKTFWKGIQICRNCDTSVCFHPIDNIWIEVQELWLHLGVLFPRISSRTKNVHFQNVDKWCGEWSELHHTNAGCRDLQNTWIMFDHVKRVVRWITMAFHVYDLAYCKMMAMVVCDMQSKDTKVQQIMWTRFNEIMLKHRFPNHISKDSWFIVHKPIGL
jgi:hypothetical protein